MMTQEDKYWIAGGATLAVGGGIYWYLSTRKAKDDATAVDATYIDGTANNVAITGGSSTHTTTATKPKTPVIPVSKRQPDTVAYAIGQEVMAIGSTGTKTYDVTKGADGIYRTKSILKATFAKGDPIGKIIWVGLLADGTRRYVIERNGNFQKGLYWVADVRVIAPIGKVIPRSDQATTGTTLNITLLLQKGSKGNEVKEIQKRLGFSGKDVDGDFGNKTYKALHAMKGVYSITLATWNNYPKK